MKHSQWCSIKEIKKLIIFCRPQKVLLKWNYLKVKITNPTIRILVNHFHTPQKKYEFIMISIFSLKKIQTLLNRYSKNIQIL